MTEERRRSDERLATLEEGFRRHEKDCTDRQQTIMNKLDSLSAGIHGYRTDRKVLVVVATLLGGAVLFIIEYFKEPILALLK